MTDTVSTCVSEPLPLLARFSWDWAPYLCDPSHGCCDYHRCWSMLRWLELNSALPVGFDFFKREIDKLVALGKKRVLISGGADAGLTALVYSAFQACGVTPDIVFVDRCKTTVWQNRLLADSLQLDIEFHQCNIQQLDCEPVDLVVAHSFLLFFPEPQRQQVIEVWARLLKPGGVALISNVTTDDPAVAPPARDEHEIVKRLPLLIEAGSRAGLSKSQAAELGATAERFWRKKQWQAPYITMTNLRESLEKAGLTMEQFDGAGEAIVGPRGAFGGSNSSRIRAEVVARK